MEKERIIGFDFARVISILVVIGIYHNLGYAGRFHSEPAVRVLVYSSLGVFTFISSLLLASKYSFSNVEETLSFYKKRVLRIWPLFVVSSLILAILGFNSWFTTFKGIVGISPFWAPHPTTMWYVAMLISLYIITPFVVHGNVRQRCAKSVIIMTIIGMIQLLFGTVVPRTFNYFTVYLIGLILGSGYNKQTIAFLRSKEALLISVAWIIMTAMVYYTKNAYLKSFASVVGIIAILNISLLISDRLKTRSFFTKSVTVLSFSSFCAYLFHREIIWALFRVYKPEGFLPVFLEVLFIGVPLSFLCAYFIQKFYDLVLLKLDLCIY